MQFRRSFLFDTHYFKVGVGEYVRWQMDVPLKFITIVLSSLFGTLLLYNIGEQTEATLFFWGGQ